MERHDLAEMEAVLYETIGEYNRTVNDLVSGINERNVKRSEATRKSIRAASARKKFLGLAVFAASAAGAVFYYKFVLGLF